MAHVIQATALTVAIGRKTILDHVSLTVSAGRTAALLGGTGAGKSTLIHTLLGRVRRSGGDLHVCGLDPETSPREIARLITYVANPDVFEPHLTLGQNVVHLLRLAGAAVPPRQEVTRALRDADVPDRAIAGLGTQTKGLIALSAWLAISRLRASNLVLLDDPTEYVSPSDALRLASLLRDVAERGTAILVATRDERFAEECASTVYLLEAGQVASWARSRSALASRSAEEPYPSYRSP